MECRKYKTFDKKNFLHNLDEELLKGAIYQNYEKNVFNVHKNLSKRFQ